MSDDGIPLKYAGVDRWTCVPVGEYRLYYKLDTHREGSGFEFKCLAWVAGTSYGPDEKVVAYADPWDDPGVRVERVMCGRATFDGLKHVWFGGNSNPADGYLNYPDSLSLVALTQKLAELEKQHCWGCSQNEAD